MAKTYGFKFTHKDLSDFMKGPVEDLMISTYAKISDFLIHPTKKTQDLNR